MTPGDDLELARKKSLLRDRCRANRQAQTDKDRLSEIICQSLAELPEYQAARRVLFYVDTRSEVRTLHFLPTAMAEKSFVAVPYCQADRLELFRLESLDELAVGSYRILEPRAELRGQADRQVSLDEVDLVVVPGVAFDRRGGRLGNGLGYYDRLLAGAPPQTLRAGLAFECQICPAIPTTEHDVLMHVVITESAVYRSRVPTSGVR